MFRFLSHMLIAATMATAMASSVSAADADVLREAQDRADIEALLWRYVRALDSFDAEAYASVFTDDGQFGDGPNAVTGRAALAKMVTDLKNSRAERAGAGESVPAMYHMITNSYTEFVDRDHARVHTYWLTVFGATPGEAPPRVAAAGRGIDELVRVDGRWLIKLRNVAPQ